MQDTVFSAITGACAAIAGGLLSGVYQHARDYLRRPVLELSYKDDAPYRTKANFKESGRDVTELYVRLKLRNTGSSTAVNCRLFIIEGNYVKWTVVEVVSNEEKSTAFYDSRPLSWAGYDFEPRDVPIGVAYFADLVGILTDRSDLRFKVRYQTQAEQSMKSYIGTYRFTVVTTSDNAKPVTLRIDVTHNGKPDQLRAVVK